MFSASLHRYSIPLALLSRVSLRAAVMPERSKGFRSSRNIFVCLGSNPSYGISFFCIFFWVLDHAVTFKPPTWPTLPEGTGAEMGPT